ncbi:MFS transporter [Arsenicicoccus sp. oral taxon 190]|uniref:MFS transporter n=1 Tax=Arsenicicoccus sp. oral taxon 190 TaxID=1658671 RepID=UPI00067A2F8A|nr:MFS transporter [Arsenicicoccus sp. oral taxon 190]AKT51882.1 MFS transporter [Arsenicicoccus sp. oral taxon 190]
MTQPRNRWLVLAICCMSLFIVGLDVSALNLALPSLQRDLHVSPSRLQWVLDSYTVVLASLLMLSGSVADRVGRRRVFQVGLVTFGIGSALCAFSTSGEMLIACRVLQAVGGSMLNPVAMSIITTTFTDARERAQAIGFWGGTIGLSMALGPVVGGVLVETLGWQAVFWMNVPVTLAAFALAARYVPESRAPRPRRLDPAGQALVMVGLGSVTFALIEGREAGWASPLVLGCLAASVVATATLVAVELRAAEPLIDPRFFLSLPFTGAVASAVVGFAAQAGFLLVNTLYLQSERGLSPLHAGLMTVPMAVCTGLLAPVSGRVVGVRGPRLPMVLAGLGIAASALVLGTITATTSTPVLLLAYVLFGCGFGLLNAPITNAAVTGMPRSRAGVAAAVASTSRQVGAALGVAVFGTLAFSALGTTTSSLALASRTGWHVMAGCGALLVATGLVATTPAARRSSQRVADLLGAH